MGQLKENRKFTPLFQAHQSLGAKLIDFGGWCMPVDYGSITQEHLAVRTTAGLFDVSHMGEIEITGPQALDLVQIITSNDAARLKNGSAQYTALTHPEGSAVDDCVVHRLEEQRYFFCVNASNTEKDFQWISRHNDFDAKVSNVSGDYAQLALQGPRAEKILSPLMKMDLSSLRYYNFAFTRCSGIKCLLARTGYSGEDGFEIYVSPADSVRLWDALLQQGRGDGLRPAGLGARNTLRLEAGYPLYGHELDEKIGLLEAGLGWICKLQKKSFIGKEALLHQKKKGLRRKLVGIEMASRSIARDGYPLYFGKEKVGIVTSGSFAPFLKKNIALAYISIQYSRIQTPVQVGIRSRREAAHIVPLPFYKRQRQ